MGSDAADIDDVLKESEALLDRLQSNSSNSITNEVYDGGASLASLGSLSLRDVASVLASVTDSTAKDAGSRASDTPGKGRPLPQLPANSPEKGAMVGSEPPQASQPRAPPQWEKVSSASMGDQDYVPIVDYTKVKRNNNAPASRASKAKISRLEAYREKARKKRRRRRIVTFAVAILLVCIFWAWSRREHVSRYQHLQSDHLSGNTNATHDTNIDPLSSFATESEPTHEEDPGAEICQKNFDAEFSAMLEDIRPLKSKDEAFAAEMDKQSNEGESERASPAPISPGQSDVQTTDVLKCKNPFVRLFSRKCRSSKRENLLVEVAAYLY